MAGAERNVAIDPLVWDFDRPRAYLHAWRRARRLRSYGWIAMKMECAVGHVHAMFKEEGRSRRPILPASEDKLVALLHLGGAEAAYFRALVRSEDGATERERVEALASAARLRRVHHAAGVSADDLPMIENWYYAAIHALGQTPWFRADALWIARTLRPRVTPEEAQRALDFMLDRGHLVETPDGVRARADDLVVNFGADPDAYRKAMRAWYRWFIERGPAAMEEFSPEERWFGAVAGAIPVERYAEAAAILDEARGRILALGDGEAAGEHRAYGLTMYMFPLSAPVGPRR